MKHFAIRILMILMVFSWEATAAAKGHAPRPRPKPAALRSKPTAAKPKPKPSIKAKPKVKVKPPIPSKSNVNQKLINNAIAKDSSQRKNGSIFWSGQTATVNPKLDAEKMANKLNAKHPNTKHSSLEMVVDKSKVQLPRGDKAWKTSSGNFAKDANGKVRIVLGPEPRANSVLNRVEIPELTKSKAQGGKVTQINVFQVNKNTGTLEKKHRWYNDGTPYDGPGSKGSTANGDWTPNIAPKKK